MADADTNLQAFEAQALGWICLEADRTMNRHDLTVRHWPGGGEPVLHGHAHAHGFWVEWLG